MNDADWSTIADVAVLAWIAAFLWLKAWLITRVTPLGRWMAATNVVIGAAYCLGIAFALRPELRSEHPWLVWAARLALVATVTPTVVVLLKATRPWERKGGGGA